MGASGRAGVVATVWAALVALGCTLPKPDDDPAPPIPERLPLGPSCERAPSCGAAGDSASCCDSPWVPGGSFEMGFSVREGIRPDALREEDREHTVSVSGYFLDRFEITWSRLEAYADQYPGAPAAGSGAHPALPASGWDPGWDDELPSSGEALLEQLRSVSTAGASSKTAAGELFPSSLAAREDDMAADGLSWFVAFAFCIWDGGRLPTEAEWEYAAAGGALNYPYPWGADGEPTATLRTPVAVGSHPELRGVFGQDDLAGGEIEWAFDWFSRRYYLEGGLSCVDCANTQAGLSRVVRGDADNICCGGDVPTEYRAAARNGRAPGALTPGVGARCARDVAR